MNDDRKGRPDPQMRPDRCSACTENFEIETIWRREYNLSPSSTYVHQYVPIPYRVNAGLIILTGVKYSKQDIVWERADCWDMSGTLACAVQKSVVLATVTTAVYLDR